MKKIIATTVIICCLFLNSCFPAIKSQITHICAAFSVPGMMESDGRRSIIRTIETDMQGRKLFAYETTNSILHKTTEVYVIMQKSDKNYVYFYEDENYLFDTSSSEEIEAFKTRNDWNLELQPEKMSRRPLQNFTFDLVMFVRTILDREKAENAIMTNIPFPVDEVYCLYVEDCDYSKNELYYFEGMAGNETKKYFVIIDDTYSPKFMEIINDTVDDEAFKEFKRQSGWKYGL